MLFILLLLLALDAEEVCEVGKVFLQNEAEALGVQARAREVTVVGLVIDLDGEVSAGSEQVLQVEIADERGGGVGVVAIAKLAVDEQSVVE